MHNNKIKKINIKFAETKEGAKIPSKNNEDAGYDIYACFEEPYITIDPLETVNIPTGIASALPNTHYFQIQERGSTGTKGMKYGAGVIDSGYRGEWFIPITNCSYKTIVILKNDIGIGEVIAREIDKGEDESMGAISDAIFYMNHYSSRTHSDENIGENVDLSAVDLVKLILEDKEYMSEILIYPYEKAIAQAVLLEVPSTEIEEVSYEELQKIPSDRGCGKLGSSGK